MSSSHKAGTFLTCAAAVLLSLPAHANPCEPPAPRAAQPLLQAAEADELFARALVEAAHACRIPGELCDGALQRCRDHAQTLNAAAAAHDEAALRADLAPPLGDERFSFQLPPLLPEAPAHCVVTRVDLAGAQASKRRTSAEAHRRLHAEYARWSQWVVGAKTRCVARAGTPGAPSAPQASAPATAPSVAPAPVARASTPSTAAAPAAVTPVARSTPAAAQPAVPAAPGVATATAAVSAPAVRSTPATAAAATPAASPASTANVAVVRSPAMPPAPEASDARPAAAVPAVATTAAAALPAVAVTPKTAPEPQAPRERLVVARVPAEHATSGMGSSAVAAPAPAEREPDAQVRERAAVKARAEATARIEAGVAAKAAREAQEVSEREKAAALAVTQARARAEAERRRIEEERTAARKKREQERLERAGKERAEAERERLEARAQAEKERQEEARQRARDIEAQAAAREAAHQQAVGEAKAQQQARVQALRVEREALQRAKAGEQVAQASAEVKQQEEARRIKLAALDRQEQEAQQAGEARLQQLVATEEQRKDESERELAEALEASEDPRARPRAELWLAASGCTFSLAAGLAPDDGAFLGGGSLGVRLGLFGEPPLEGGMSSGLELHAQGQYLRRLSGDSRRELIRAVPGARYWLGRFGLGVSGEWQQVRSSLSPGQGAVTSSALLVGPQLAFAVADGSRRRLVLSGRWLPLLKGTKGAWGATAEAGMGPLFLGAELLHLRTSGDTALEDGWVAAASVGYRARF